MKNIYIDPRSNIVYASYYIEGLYLIYGKKNVKFSMTYFKELKQSSKHDDFDHYFAFVLVEKNNVRRVIIDFRDKNTIQKQALRWSDVYGKVNYNSSIIELLDEESFNKKKILPIGPNFGVRLWSNYITIYYLLINYIKSIGYIGVSFRSYLSGYRWQMKRQKYEQYKSSELINKDYVFFISSLYKNENHGPSTNSFRAAFIRACKKNVAEFEGGLYAKKDNPNINFYSDVVTYSYVKNYNQKIKKSKCVFNTPAVHGCHGWKLGEYMAIGKAIISMNFINQLPYELINEHHIHFVSDVSELDSAVKKIVDDDIYRLKLEKNVKEYFEKKLSPTVVINKLLNTNK